MANSTGSRAGSRMEKTWGEAVKLKIYVRKMKTGGWYWMCNDSPAPIVASCCGFNWCYDSPEVALERGSMHALRAHGVRL